ncbi:MAG: hypothetical protein ACXWK2_05345, partial [Rhizomicrobium sp.]
FAARWRLAFACSRGRQNQASTPYPLGIFQQPASIPSKAQENVIWRLILAVDPFSAFVAIRDLPLPDLNAPSIWLICACVV